MGKNVANPGQEQDDEGVIVSEYIDTIIRYYYSLIMKKLIQIELQALSMPSWRQNFFLIIYIAKQLERLHMNCYCFSLFNQLNLINLIKTTKNSKFFKKGKINQREERSLK